MISLVEKHSRFGWDIRSFYELINLFLIINVCAFVHTFHTAHFEGLRWEAVPGPELAHRPHRRLEAGHHLQVPGRRVQGQCQA